MAEPISADAFKVLVQRAGLALTPERFEELRTAYGFMSAMTARMHARRGYDAEPAHIFKPAER